MSERFKSGILASVFILLFMFSTYLSAKYQETIADAVLVWPGWVGMGSYILITTASVVIAPVVTVPLVPVAASIWGNLGAALLSALGWTTGSLIAFWIARCFGQPAVERIVSPHLVQKIEEYIPDKRRNLFWWVVLLRVSLPEDILSYALGLFTRVPFRVYALATVIGTLPGAFVFSYVGELPMIYQALVLAAGGVAVLVMAHYAKHHAA